MIVAALRIVERWANGVTTEVRIVLVTTAYLRRWSLFMRLFRSRIRAPLPPRSSFNDTMVICLTMLPSNPEFGTEYTHSITGPFSE